MPTGGFESARYDLTLQSEISDAFRACLQVKSPFNTSRQNLIYVTRRASQTLNGTQTMEHIPSLAVKLSLDQESNNRK